jgi:hypothetical protein
MNFSSPQAPAGFGKVPSLIQETKVLARSPAGFFLPGVQADDWALPNTGKTDSALGRFLNTGCSNAARP